jgi:hypothetical protein
MNTIRHCVVPAAGLGTRFLPATKVLPKEMLPVVDRPVIEWAIEEAMAAGASEMVLIIANGKELIQAHFEPSPELERVLERRGKTTELAAVRHSQELAHITRSCARSRWWDSTPSSACSPTIYHTPARRSSPNSGRRGRNSAHRSSPSLG